MTKVQNSVGTATGALAAKNGAATPGLTETADDESRRSADRPLRRDGDRIVAGKGEYLDDLAPAGTLHTAILRSPHARARITSIDTSAAGCKPGVRAVLTGQDEDTDVALEHFFDPGKFELNTSRFTILAREDVRWAGEPIAAVAADSLAQAEAAVEAIDVQYEVLPAVFDARKALEDDAPRVFEDWDDNAIGRFPFTSGDADAKIAAAPHTLRHTVEIGRHQSTPMEGRGYIADWRGSRLSFWGSTQSPHMVRTYLATALGLPEERIKVVAPRLGGGFGHKFAGYAEEALVCLLSKSAGAPVKWLESRRDSLLVGARECSHDFEFGFDDTGRLLGFKDRMLGNVGCLSTWGGWPMIYVGGMTFPGPYTCGDYAVEAIPVVTNKAPWNGYRSYGKEQVAVVMERVMDLIARHLGLDPVEVRRVNFVPSDAFPRWTPTAHLDSGDYQGAMDNLLELCDYPALLERRELNRSMDTLIGVGVGFELTPENGEILNSWSREYDTSTVRVNPTGGVSVLTGVTSPGTGNETTIAYLVARELGIRCDRVEVIQGDTDTCPFGFGSFSSRSLTTGGSAAILAARDVRARMESGARVLLDLPEGDLVFVDSEVRAADDPRKHIGFGELAEMIYKMSLGTPGLENPLLESTRVDQPQNYLHHPDEQGRTSTFPTYAFSAHLAVVEVERDTGVMHLTDYFAVDDCGTVINPHFVEGQVNGALAQGLGGAAWEESVYDTEAGRLVADSFKAYLVPRAPDLPTFRTRNQQTPSPYTLLGQKGAGDGCVGGAMAALTNAVNDALAPVGGELSVLPLTPPRILTAIQHAQHATTGGSVQ